MSTPKSGTPFLRGAREASSSKRRDVESLDEALRNEECFDRLVAYRSPVVGGAVRYYAGTAAFSSVDAAQTDFASPSLAAPPPMLHRPAGEAASPKSGPFTFCPQHQNTESSYAAASERMSPDELSQTRPVETSQPPKDTTAATSPLGSVVSSPSSCDNTTPTRRIELPPAEPPQSAERLQPLDMAYAMRPPPLAAGPSVGIGGMSPPLEQRAGAHNPRQLPERSFAMSLAAADSARYLTNVQSRQPQVMKQVPAPQYASGLVAGGPRSADRAATAMSTSSSLRAAPTSSPPPQIFTISERLRELSQVSGGAKERSTLIQKLSQRQAHESAARIGRQRAMDIVTEAKLSAQRKIVMERRETDVLHSEQMHRDEIHRERSTSFLELTLQIREQHHREAREKAASREADDRQGILRDWLSGFQQLQGLATSHGSFVMRTAAIRESELHCRNRIIEAAERGERLALRRLFTEEWFAVQRGLCQVAERDVRATIVARWTEQCACLAVDCERSCSAAIQQTMNRFRRERAVLESSEERSRQVFVSVTLAGDVDELLRRGQSSYFTHQNIQLQREERQQRDELTLEMLRALDAFRSASTTSLRQSLESQQQREETERTQLAALAITDLVAVTSDEACERKALVLRQLAEWTAVNGALRRQDLEYSETQSRSSIGRDWRREMDQLQAAAARSAERIALVLEYKLRCRQIAGEEEDCRALLAASASTSKNAAAQNERDRLGREAAQARLQALRAQAQRSTPFLGLSLAEKVSSSSVDKRLKDNTANHAPHLIVDSLVVNGPAYLAGLRLLDRVVSVAGVWSTSLAAVRATISQRAVVGAQIELRVKRPRGGDSGIDAEDQGTADEQNQSDEEEDEGSPSDAIMAFVVDVKTIDEQFRELREWFFELEAGGSGGTERIERGSASPGYATRRRRSIIDKMGPPRRGNLPPQSAAVAASPASSSSPEVPLASNQATSASSSGPQGESDLGGAGKEPAEIVPVPSRSTPPPPASTSTDHQMVGEKLPCPVEQPAQPKLTRPKQSVTAPAASPRGKAPSTAAVGPQRAKASASPK